MQIRGMLVAVALLATQAFAGPMSGLTKVLNPAGADQSAPVTAPAPIAMDEASITARRKAAQAALARADNPETADEQPPLGTPTEEVAHRRFLLQSLVAAYDLQLDMLHRAEVVRARGELLSTSDLLGQFDALGDPPYSVVTVDRLRQQLQTIALSIDAIETQQTLVAKERDIASREYAASELKLRQSVEAQEKNRDPLSATRLKWLHGMVTLRARASGAMLQARNQQAAVLADDLAQSNALFRELEARVAKTDHKVRFNAADRETLLARQAERQAAIEAELADARKAAVERGQALTERQREREQLRETLENLQTALDAARQAGAEPPAPYRDKGKHAKPQNIDALEAEVKRQKQALARGQRLLELEQIRVMTAGDKVDVLTRLIDSQRFQGTFWELRYAAAQPGATPAAMEALRKGVSELTDRISEPRKILRHELQLTLDEISVIQDRLIGASPEETVLIRSAIDTMQERVQLQLRGLSEVGQLSLMASRWSEEFDRQAADRSAQARLSEIRKEVSDIATAVWSYEFTTVDDTAVVDGQSIPTKRGVTVGKLVIALITLFAGFWLAKRIAQALSRRIHERFDIPLQTLNTASNWVLSGVFVVLFLISLAIVRIPLTVFAFLGGAIAIGAGFGMQTLLKNLMSGLMLLVERPFKLGDTVEVAGKRGTVTDIGVRASTIRNIDGIETLVPNASFIEQEVTNWTYTSGKVRFAVKIGVAYGSPARQVAELLLDVAHRHGKILKDPEPEVLFEDFGADALNFGLYFWLDLDAGTAGRIVTSDVRFMIDKAFAEAGIAIAFPQRDIHLDTTRPLEIRMLGNEPPTSPAAN